MERGDGGGLLERETEIARSERALGRAREGSGQVVTLLGAPGIGKTSLLAEARRAAERAGMRVLVGRGSELEHGYAFGVARQLLEPVLIGADPQEREELLAGSAALATHVVLEPPTPAEARPETEFAILHGLYWLVANLADRGPLLLAVDDAHWSDTPSLHFLAYLAGRVEGLSIVLAVAARIAEPGADRPELEALAGTDPIALRPAALSEEAVGELVRWRFGGQPSRAFTEACHAATEGNPFLVRELLTELESEGVEPDDAAVGLVGRLGPSSISRSVLARIGRAGEEVRRLARAVAVLGDDAELRDAGALAELDPERVDAATDVLVRAGVLDGTEPLSFVHPVVRAAIYEDIAPSDRSRGHARAAAILAERIRDPERLAAHLVAVSPGADAALVERLRAAAASALARGAPDSAAAYLERALAERSPEGIRGSLLASLGGALVMSGRRVEAIAWLREAIALLDEPTERAHAARLLAGALVLEAAGGAEAVRVLDEAIDRLPPDAQELGVRLEADIATAEFVSLSARRAAAERRRRFDDPDSPQLLASAAMTTAMYDGPAKRTADLARRALVDGELLVEETSDSPNYWLAALALVWAGEATEAAAAMSEAMQEARQRGSARGTGLAACFRAVARLHLGDLRSAEADGRLFFELAPESFEVGPAFLIDALVEQGRLEEADGLCAALSGSIETTMHHFALASVARLRIAQGRAREGLDSLREIERGLEEWGTSTPGPIQWRPLAAETLAALGEPAEAEALLAAELEACRSYGEPARLGTALTAAGTVAGGERAIELLDEAERTLAPTHARLAHAKALLELGAAVRRAGRRADSREPLGEAMALARRCGATPVAQRAYEELRAAGARPHRVLETGLDALTASERRVAEMAASGMGNRAIAQALFVTSRTVETHLSHTYQKLDIHSRSELAGRLAEKDPRPRANLSS